MKKLTKVLAAVMALALIFALSAGAFAADNDGSITISNATKTESYSIYKIFDLTYNANGDVAYSYTKTGEADAVFAALNASGSPFVLTTGIGACYNVTSEATDAEISAWIKENLIDTELVSAASTKFATADTVSFTDLPYGYYYITSSLGSTATIDSTCKAVTVIDKNQTPGWSDGKVIDENGNPVVNSVNIGDTVDFSIGIKGTNYIGDQKITYYYIKDTLTGGLAYVDADKDGKADLVVKVDDATLTAGKDYTVTMSSDGKSFELVIDWADGNSTDGFSPIYSANADINVSYSTILTEEAIIAEPGNGNSANFTYKTNVMPNPDSPENPVPYDEENTTTTKTYTFALGFRKIDGETKAPLAGASFSVKDPSGETVYAKPTGTAGVYMFCDAKAVGALSVFATDADGKLVIEGVKEGEYEVTEEIAPAGYNMLTESFKAEASIAGVEEYSTTYVTYFDADGKIVEEAVLEGKSLSTTYPVKASNILVENNAGAELPSTGGIGTTIFYILGAVLLIGAAVLLVVKKRMSYEK